VTATLSCSTEFSKGGVTKREMRGLRIRVQVWQSVWRAVVNHIERLARRAVYRVARGMVPMMATARAAQDC
jgi:hypothetical protein